MPGFNDIEYGNVAYAYTAFTGDVTVGAGASLSLTIQQPANPNPKRTVKFLTATVQGVGNAFTIDQYQNGVDQTATAVVPVPLNPQQPANPAALNPASFTASLALAFRGTAVPANAVKIANTISAPATSVIVIDLSAISLAQIAPNNNLTIVLTNSGLTSDTQRITIQFLGE